ncbi:hypothetical protein PVAND_013121 [Polypedilum vanderplanki]|uniref:Uncharacterized protein n=1 Tax=Polypedilum vanderplanki TaxID=319348 RepID=A0A9J6CQI1_POLVA|nr:hypothetical protein PVAND_013121 [Polypedilum vanderplanki]
MSNRKFFSGLPERMMRQPNGANRQQTNFYWPDDTRSPEITSPRNRMRNRSLSTASIISQSQASTDTEESRRRRTNQMKSRIEFYDMVDTATDNVSVYSRQIDPTKHKKLETLKSRIEFYDFADANNDDDKNSVIEVVKKEQEVMNNNKIVNEPSPEVIKAPQIENPIVDELTNGVNKISINNNKNSQYIDSFSESEDENYRYQKPRHYREPPVDRNLPQATYRRPPIPQQKQSPRRYNSHYFDDEYDDGYDRYYDNRSVRSRYSRTMSRRNYSPDISDDEYYYDRRRISKNYQQPFSPEREYDRYYDSYREERRINNQRNMNGFSNEFEKVQKVPKQQQSEIESEQLPQQQQQQTTSARPPIKPVARSMSISEARRRHHVNLKSNIFHTDNEYDQSVEQRKPLSVRDFAANHRVGVGLPDFQ